MRFTLITSLPKTMSIIFGVNGKLLEKSPTPNGNKYAYEVEGGTVEVHIKTYHELNSRLWIFRVIAFWLLGIFGIFTPAYDKFYLNIDTVHKFKLNAGTENTVIMGISPARVGKVPILIKPTGCELLTENKETYELDQVMIKRAKRVRILSRICSWVAVAGVAFLVVALLS